MLQELAGTGSGEAGRGISCTGSDRCTGACIVVGRTENENPNATVQAGPYGPHFNGVTKSQGILELETWNTHTLIQEYARGHSYHENSRLREGDTRFKLEL